MSDLGSEAQMLHVKELTDGHKCYISKNIDCDVLVNVSYHETTASHIIYKIQKERKEVKRNF